MNIVLSASCEAPIYEQVYDQLSAQIISGELEANLCLPSIRSVATELGISIITVKKAWELLEANGFIYTRAGKGCFVSEHSRPKLEDKRTALARERLSRELTYYKGLGLTSEELIELLKEVY